MRRPFRLRHWQLPQTHGGARFCTAARPGRTGNEASASAKVSDQQIINWLHGLPLACRVIISVLGTKPKGHMSEWSFYSFDKKGFSFQNWLDENAPGYIVLERPTFDFTPVPVEICQQILSDVQKCESNFGYIPVIMDSGGVGRTGQVCRWMKAVERSDS